MSAHLRPALPPSPLLPLLPGAPDSPIAFAGGGWITRARFADEVRGVAASLPDIGHVVNLCEDRYRFLVALCAAAIRGQVTLLPPSRTRTAIDDVRARHPASYCIGDVDDCGCEAGPIAALSHYQRLPDVLPRVPGAALEVARDALAVIGFTSGSTGAPTPNPKRWGMFATSTAQNVQALSSLWPAQARPSIVATVPPQHMFGMELSVLWPMLSEAAVHGARPFFPGDIAQALAEMPAPRVLVTTPVHLRALVESAVALPPMAAITTATAPLPQAQAQAAEDAFGCPVREVFGSTETCIIASRRTVSETAWTLFPGVTLQPRPEGTLVQGAHLPEAVELADLIAFTAPDRFELRGRQADLLEIAGKRVSLGELTRRLLDVPGVRDGVVVQLDETDAGGVRRIAALAVCDGVDEAAILRALRASIDPVFLPRRVRCVASLPRNETGKLPRSTVLALLKGDGG